MSLATATLFELATAVARAGIIAPYFRAGAHKRLLWWAAAGIAATAFLLFKRI